MPPGPNTSRPVRVMHLITGTGVGGAEMMLFKLLSGLDRSKFRSAVISMLPPGPMADQISTLGIEVTTLGLTRGSVEPAAVFRLARALHAWRPDVLQTWMYHADLLGGLVARLISGIPVVWNIRHADLQPGGNAPMTLRIASLCASISGWVPDRIIACAHSSREIHGRLGYQTDKMCVIPNGFDLDLYRRREDSDIICQERFGIPAGKQLVTQAGRYHPQKDHANFLEAARLCAIRMPETVFALCGDGITPANDDLMALVNRAGLGANLFLPGRLSPENVACLMSRSTVLANSSSAEAFPNVVGEGMAAGAICVVTDAGDSAYIVGDTGLVVPPHDSLALSEAWIQVLRMDEPRRQSLRAAARARIEQNFSLAAIVARYQNLYLDMLA